MNLEEEGRMWEIDSEIREQLAIIKNYRNYSHTISIAKSIEESLIEKIEKIVITDSDGDEDEVYRYKWFCLKNFVYL